jgi:hypothetical protein
MDSRRSGSGGYKSNSPDWFLRFGELREAPLKETHERFRLITGLVEVLKSVEVGGALSITIEF